MKTMYGYFTLFSLYKVLKIQCVFCMLQATPALCQELLIPKTTLKGGVFFGPTLQMSKLRLGGIKLIFMGDMEVSVAAKSARDSQVQWQVAVLHLLTYRCKSAAPFILIWGQSLPTGWASFAATLGSPNPCAQSCHLTALGHFSPETPQAPSAVFHGNRV